MKKLTTMIKIRPQKQSLKQSYGADFEQKASLLTHGERRGQVAEQADPRRRDYIAHK